MSLQSWRQNGWLVQHATSAEEIANLLALSDRDLAACQVKQLPSDWRFAIASTMQDCKPQPPRWLLRVIELPGTTITTALSNRWSSRRPLAKKSSTLLTAFERNAISAATISQAPCLTEKRTRCSNSQ